MKLRLSLLLLIFAIASSCDDNPLPNGSNDSTIAFHIGQTNRTGDDLELIQVRKLDSNKLELEVVYGGGCKVHEFDFYWDGLIMESQPPQAAIIVVHDANRDGCEALIHEKPVFNLDESEVDIPADLIYHIYNSDKSQMVSTN